MQRTSACRDEWRALQVVANDLAFIRTASTGDGVAVLAIPERTVDRVGEDPHIYAGLAALKRIVSADLHDAERTGELA